MYTMMAGLLKPQKKIAQTLVHKLAKIHHFPQKGKADVGFGLDHRCVHYTMKIQFPKKRFRKQSGFKCWRPILDEHGHPTCYQQHIREMIQLV